MTRRYTISNGKLGGNKSYAIWVDDFGEPEKVGCNFEDTGYLTPSQTRVAAADMMRAAHVAESNRCLDPSKPDDRRLMTISNLIAEAHDIAEGRAEILFADSMGFIDMRESGEAVVQVIATFTTIDGLPVQLSPERVERIVAALKHAMEEVKRQ